jgi:hypothetical protein
MVITPLNVLMIDQISKLKDHVNVSIMKVVQVDESNFIHNRRIQCVIWESHCIRTAISKIVFAHAEALLEDIFFNIY